MPVGGISGGSRDDPHIHIVPEPGELGVTREVERRGPLPARGRDLRPRPRETFDTVGGPGMSRWMEVTPIPRRNHEGSRSTELP